MTPAEHYDFGEVRLGDGASVAVSVTNPCGETVTIREVSVPDSERFKVLVATPFDVARGETVTFDVFFVPDDRVEVAGTLELLTTDFDQPVIRTLLTGTGVGSRIDVAYNDPFVFDGPARCRVRQNITLSNTGNDDLFVSEIQTTTPYFQFRPGPPYFIAPGGEQDVLIDHRAEEGLDAIGRLTFLSDDPDTPELVVPFTARVDAPLQIEQRFVMPAPKVDLLVTAQPSGDRQHAAQLEHLWELVPAFAGFDVRIGFIARDDGCVLGDLPYLDPTMPDEQLRDAVAVMTEGSDEAVDGDRGFSLAWAHLTGDCEPWRRPDAVLGVLHVSEGMDDSPWTALDWVDAVSAQATPDWPLQVHAATGMRPEPCEDASAALNTLRAVDATRGVAMSICDMGAAGYFDPFARALERDPAAVPLAETPIPWTIAVEVDGAAESAWSWDAAAEAVVFVDAPAPGSVVVVRYEAVPDCSTSGPP